MRILIVDDEEAVRTAVRRALVLAGYDVEMAANGEEALSLLAERAPDAIVLDVLMPGVDGIEVCKRLRAAGDHTPVLMLTARDAVGDRVAGLDAGADDYMVKPFALQELQARLRALLRRSGNNATDDATALRFDDLTLDVASRIASRNGRQIDLSAREFKLLEALMRNQGSVCPRSMLLQEVWEYDFDPGTNLVDVYIRKLREKVDNDFDRQLLHTARGIGYLIRE
jgi:two-component system response regulator MprA